MLLFLFPLRAHSPFREMREVKFAEVPEDESQEAQADEADTTTENGGADVWDAGSEESPVDSAEEGIDEAAAVTEQQNVDAEQAKAELLLLQKATEDAAKTDLGTPDTFAALPKEEKDQKIADVMKTHGVSVEETEGGYTVSAPLATDKLGTSLNKFSGFLQGIALKIAPLLKKLEPVLKQFKKFGDQISGKKPEEPVLSKEEASKERIQEKMKAQPDTAILETEITTTRDTAKTEKEYAENDKQTLENKIAIDRRYIDAKRTEILGINPSDKDSIVGLEKQISILEGNIKEKETKITEAQKKIDEQTKIVDEAELDLKSLADIQKETRKEKEEKKVASIPNDGEWHEASEIVGGEAGWKYKITPDKRAVMDNPTKINIYQPETGLWVGPVSETKIANPTLKGIYNNLRGGMTKPDYWASYAAAPGFGYSIDLTDQALISKQIGGTKVYKLDTNTQKWNDVGNYDHAAAFNNSELGKNIIQERNTKENEVIALINTDGNWHDASEIVGGETGCSYIIGPKGKAYKQSVDKSILVYDEGTASWESPADVFKIPDAGGLSNKYNQLLAFKGNKNWLKFDNEPENYAIRVSDGAMMRKTGNNVHALNVGENMWKNVQDFDPAKQ